MSVLLGRLGRRVGWDLPYLFGGSAWLLLRQGVSHFLAFAQLVLLANLFSAEVYGTFQYVQSVYSAVFVLALPGLTTALSRSIAAGYDASLPRAVSLRARWAILAATVGLGVAGWTWASGERQLALAIALAALTLPVTESAGLYSAVLLARQAFRARMCTGVTIDAATVAAVALMTLVGTTLGLVAGYYTAALVANVFCYRWVVRTFPPGDRIDLGMNRYAFSLSLLNGLSALTLAADTMVLYHFVGPIGVAQFSVAAAFPRRLKGVLSTVGDLALPRFVSREPSTIRRSLPAKLLVEFIAILAVVVVYVMLAPLLLSWFFPRYLSATLLAQVLAFYAFIGLSYPIAAYLQAHAMVRQLTVLSVAVAIAKLGSLVVLVPLWGVWGAAISMLIAAGLNVAISLAFILSRRRKIV